jgi:polyhydroxyalkanoate synthesis regulator phasin
MTTESEMHAEPTVTRPVDDRSALAGALSKLVLASIGAMSLANETAEHVLHRLVERGELDVQHARATLDRLRPRRPHLPRPRPPVIAVGTAQLASKADIEALRQQVAALSAAVEDMHSNTPDGA